MLSIRLLEEAGEELDAAVALLESEREGYGLLFLEVYEDKLRQVRRFPESGAAIRDRKSAHQLRSFPLDRFRYSLIVRIGPEEATIIAIAHQSRQPGYWRTRMTPKGDG